MPATAEPPTVPSPPAAPPEKWAGRVAVPGAVAPGQRRAPAATQQMSRYAETAPPAAVATKRRRSRIARFFMALFALLLTLAVPVASAYVAYKLASGADPFEWPPTVDYDQIFGPRDS